MRGIGFNRGASALKPSPLMGEGWVGVNVSIRTEGLIRSPHPKPLPIKGRGFQS
jgi:hypothetical protein